MKTYEQPDEYLPPEDISEQVIAGHKVLDYNLSAHLDMEKKIKSEGNGGSTPSQYGIPDYATDLQDLIEYRNMSFAEGNIFKAIYRLGIKNERLYDLNKCKWFIERLIAQEMDKKLRNT